jgi:hypothetical protein
MDDFKQSRCFRRFALLAAISCCGSATYAEGQQANEPTSSFRTLIAQGWNGSDESATTELPSELVPQTIPTQTEASEQSAGDVDTEVSPEVETVSPKVETQIPADPRPATGLSELIRTHAKPIAVPSLATGPQQSEVSQPIVIRESMATLESTAVTEPTAVSLPIAATVPIAVPEVVELPTGVFVPSSRKQLVANESAVQALKAPTLEVQPSISDQVQIKSEQNDFERSPMTKVQPEAAIRYQPSENPISPIANAQAIRLRQAARQSLENANQRLARGATHSAKMYAMQALRSIVAMRDAVHGGNGHATQLNFAVDAIRESRDFNGTFGPIDQSALQRMVASHKTTALKDRELENLSAIEASEAYLNVASDTLFAAANGVREAAEALVILGKIERGLATMGNAHASAVAMTMQNAAVRITPNSSFAHYELGTTLMEQGLVQQAAQSLQHSVTIRPTRRGYKKLLEVSRQCGDIDTVHSCLTSLKSDHLQTDIPVQVVSPEQFASTHRPAPASYASHRTKTKSTNTGSAKSKQSDTEPTRISWRSIIPFGRK